jgi:hypothetical protein
MAASFARKVSRFFKRMGLVGYSKRRNIFGVHPLLVSTTYILLALFWATLTRKIVNALLGDNIFKRMILEFIATLELCAACFELIVVADNWGIWAYALYLFLLTIWWSKNWDTATACPYSPVEEILEGAQDVSNAALLIFFPNPGSSGYLSVRPNFVGHGTGGNAPEQGVRRVRRRSAGPRDRGGYHRGHRHLSLPPHFQIPERH